LQSEVDNLSPGRDPIRPSAAGGARLIRLLFTLTGLGLGGYLVIDYGWKDVLCALQAVSWVGLGGITLFHGLPTLLCGLAWWALLRPHSDDNWFLYFWLRWVRGSIDGIVPVLPLSGELVATRILSLRQTALAGAGIVVDLTAELIGQLLFAVLGFALLVASYPASHHLAWIALGIGVMTVQFGGFFVAQKKGFFRIIEHPFDWIRRRRRPRESKAERTLHDQILQIHAHHRAVLASVLLHLVAWVVGAMEAWIGLRLMGYPLTVTGALILESLVSAARGVIFFVPLNAGVQEGAYLLIGSLLGLPADLALALSLLKRARDLIKGVPALLTWQLIESRELPRLAARLVSQRSP
jgi:glycosyltransferase 2 family protein